MNLFSEGRLYQEKMSLLFKMLPNNLKCTNVQQNGKAVFEPKNGSKI